ncbi:hypothetical protein HDV01_001484 [Terramyces sp. JEL0728]|nr:hypothetical protein HDV01_001484 [Terramyces sp. JEL0728]
MADRPAKHWASSSKPPLRTHRPTSAPQKKEAEKPPILKKQTTAYIKSRPDSPLEDATDLLLVSPIRVASPKISRNASVESSRLNTPKKVSICEDSNEILDRGESPNLEVRVTSRENVGETQNESSLWRNPSGNAINEDNQDQKIPAELQNDTEPATEGEIASPIEDEKENADILHDQVDLKSYPKKRGSMASTYILNPNRSDLGKVLPSLKKPPGVLRTGTFRRTSALTNRPAWGARPAVKLVSKARWIIPSKKADSPLLGSTDLLETAKPPREATEDSKKWIENDASVESDEADSDESSTEKEDEIHIEFRDSSAAPIEPERVNTASTTKRKSERKSHIVPKPNPLLKMSVSQYNLFSNTAGTFRGPGDPYFAFVLGGKSVRPAAKKYKSMKLTEINDGKADEILIDKNANRFNTSSWNYRALTRLRKRYKEVVSDEVDRKVGSLEETRAYNGREAENLELKKEYNFLLADINVRVSETLKKNSDFINQIKGLQKKNTQERKDLVKTFGGTIKSWEEEEKAHLKKIDELNSVYKAKCDDLEDLRIFAKETFEDPTISAKRIEFEIEKKNDHLKLLHTKLETNMAQFDHLQEDVDNKLAETAGKIIEKAANKFESFINSKMKQALFEHTQLKSEINRQNTYIRNIEAEIERLKKERKVLQQEEPEHFDDRRRVLSLKDCMTCTPEMDIELTPYKKLPMINLNTSKCK